MFRGVTVIATVLSMLGELLKQIKKKFGDGEAVVGVFFWPVCSPYLALESVDTLNNFEQ